jgi:repressor LexA
VSVKLAVPSRAIEVLDFIEDFIDRHHYPPTYLEIQAQIGISSKSLVAYYLKKLCEAGFITWKPKAPRGIRLVNNAAVQM